MEFSRRTEIAPSTKVVPVSVVMIVKNCAEGLRKCIGSLRRNFLRDCDEVFVVDTGSTDDTPQVAKELGAVVWNAPQLRKNVRPLIEKWLPQVLEKFDKETQFKDGFLLNFAEARQIAADNARHDVQFWIDSDDIFEEKVPGQLRELVNQHMGNLDAIFLQYAYTFDKGDGKVTTVLKRERIYDRRAFDWKGRCHETCIPKEGYPLKGSGWFADYEGAIIHVGARTDHTLGDLRNYVILRSELEEDKAAKRDPDIRTLFYLGNACRGLDLHQECITLYEQVIAKSGSRDDCFASAYYVATLYLTPEVNRPVDSIDWAFRAMKIDPTDPRAPFALSRAYYLLGRYKEALHYYDMARQLPEPTGSLHSYDPEHIHSLPHYIAAFSAKELGLEARVDECMQRLVARRPNHPDTEKIAAALSNWKAFRRIEDSVKTLAANSQPANQKEAMRTMRKLVSVLKVVPDEMEEKGLGQLEDNYDADENDLVIFCGATYEAWGPKNRETGIGGSEKAVLEMSRRLQARGFSVRVYANVPKDQRGKDEFGVTWRHYSEFDESIPRETIIFWRNPSAVLFSIPCRRRIVWCHDVQDHRNWTPAICAAADEVWVLSDYHRSTLGPALERLGSKVWVTRNGIDSELIRSIDPDAWRKGAQRKKQIIYCSSPDRGVLTAIKAFQKAFPNDPEARLHICYGFNRHYLKIAARYEYGHVPDTKQNENFYSYMQRVLATVDSDERIVWHGRLGPKDLIELMRKCGVWLYPTRFPEISCMSAMEAQACGCVVVATDYAALAETIDWSWGAAIKTTPKTAAEGLKEGVEFWDDGQTYPPAEAALNRFSYETLADEWTERLRHPVPESGGRAG